MKKLVLLLTLTLPLLLMAKIPYHTPKEKRGQGFYLKACASCHGAGNRGGNLAKMKLWKHYFAEDAKVLKSLHSDNNTSMVYFNSKRFKKEQKKMLKFLLEFASDSDYIPSCNN